MEDFLFLQRRGGTGMDIVLGKMTVCMVGKSIGIIEPQKEQLPFVALIKMNSLDFYKSVVMP
jgi:hypothetical protein